jgi:hypothetical protein
MSDFRWLIEAPGQMYLAVQRLSQSDNFIWTANHDKALAFRSEDQAHALMMAVKQLAHFFNPSLFGFEASLGDAKAVEHAWASGCV